MLLPALAKLVTPATAAVNKRQPIHTNSVLSVVAGVYNGRRGVKAQCGERWTEGRMSVFANFMRCSL